MIFSPTNLIPSVLNGVNSIDAEQDNIFSAQLNGNSKVVKYRLIICLNDAQSTIVYSTGLKVLDTPIYPVNYIGEAQRLNITIPFNSGMVNGNEYKYTLEIFDDAMSVISAEELFKALKTPTLQLTVPATLSHKSYEFVGIYTQDDGIAIKSFVWQLKNNTTGAVIKQTDEVYSQDLRFFYDGFLTDNQYNIRLTVINQEGMTLDTGDIVFNVEYEMFPISGYVKVEKEKDALKVLWSPVLVVGKTAGSTEYITDFPSIGKTSLHIPKDAKVFYDTINEQKMSISGDSTYVLKSKVSPTIAKNVLYKFCGKLGDKNYFVEIYTQLHSIYLNVNNTGDHWLCNQSDADDIITIILSADSIKINILRKDGALYPNDTLYPSDALFPVDYSFVDSVDFSMGIAINKNAAINLIEICGQQTIDFFWARRGGVDDLPADNIMFDTSYEPEWDDKTIFLALFDNNMSAGNTFVNIPQFSEWHVYRQDVEAGTLTYVASTGVANAGIIDYLVSNKGTYKYYIYPIGDKIGSPLASEEISTHRTEWTLITAQEDASNSIDLVPHRVYRFYANIESSDITNNNSPNILWGFSRYPKVQTPRANAFSGQLSSLICPFNDRNNDEFTAIPNYTSLRLALDELFELSTDGRRKFLKDTIGNIFEVQISAPLAHKLVSGLVEDISNFTLPWIQVNKVGDLRMAVVL